ncbi:MAG: hypothetical protein V9E88_12035 [Ferruginibacter sp.]
MITCLLESSFNRNLGFEVNQTDRSIRKDAFWLGEGQGRVVVSVKATEKDSFENLMKAQSVPFALLGKVSAEAIIVENQSWGNIRQWKKIYDNAISTLLKNQEGEQALAAI